VIIENIHLMIKVGVVPGRGPDHVSRLEGSTGRMRSSSTHWRIFASFILTVQARVELLAEGRRAVVSLGSSYR
jgi:hypothetical protein